MKQMKVNQNRTKQKLESNQSRARELKINAYVNLCIYILCPVALFFFAGCNSGNGYTKLKTQINNLKEENAQLTKQLEQVNEENEQLNSQISVLQDLPKDVKGENLYQLQNIKVHNYSTLYDENNDGKIDTLIVRIQPVDSYGDLIKAPGTVDVELWNLNKPENQSQVGKWKVDSEELKKSWNDTLVTNYRLSFDVSEKIDKFDEPHTLKIVFTDYLSGKTFHQQKVIKP